MNCCLRCLSVSLFSASLRKKVRLSERDYTSSFGTDKDTDRSILSQLNFHFLRVSRSYRFLARKSAHSDSVTDPEISRTTNENDTLFINVNKSCQLPTKKEHEFALLLSETTCLSLPKRPGCQRNVPLYPATECVCVCENVKFVSACDGRRLTCGTDWLIGSWNWFSSCSQQKIDFSFGNITRNHCIHRVPPALSTLSRLSLPFLIVSSFDQMRQTWLERD